MRGFAFLLCSCLLLPVAQAGQTCFNGVPVEVIIDVRSAEEFAAGHIDGAINMPVDRLAQSIGTLANVDKQGQILLYCASGRRSARGRETLEQLGYTRVSDGGSMQQLQQLAPCPSPSP